MHTYNIVHADIKCDDLILMEDDRVKLIDFEGSSIDGEPLNQQIHATNSPFRILPVRTTGSLSLRTDVFAFGFAIYEILTGRPPYHELEASNNPNPYRQVEDVRI